MAAFENQWALITGASKGMGRALAEAFAGAGANLILSARSAELLAEVQAVVEAAGRQCVLVPGDLTDRAVTDQLARKAAEKNLDILVNNAGIVDIRPLHDVPPERIDLLIELNLTAPIRLTRAILPIFQAKGSGTIVNMNSGAGRKPGLHHAVYTATKFGLYGFGESLRMELKGSGIRLLSVHPGKMATQLFHAAEVEMDTGDFIPPAEVARAILSLLAMDPKCAPAELVIDRMTS